MDDPTTPNPTSATTLKRNVELSDMESLVMQRKKRIVVSSSSVNSTDDSCSPRSAMTVQDVKMICSSSTSSTLTDTRTQGIRSESKVQRAMSGRARYVNPYDQQQGPHRYHYLPNGPARRSKYDVLPKTSSSLREECSALTSSKVLSVNPKSQVTFNLHPSTASTGLSDVVAAAAALEDPATAPKAQAAMNSNSDCRRSPVVAERNKIDAGVSLSPSMTRPGRSSLQGGGTDAQPLAADKQQLVRPNEDKERDGVIPSNEAGMLDGDVDVSGYDDDADDDEDRHLGVLGSRERETREFQQFWRDRFRDVVWSKMAAKGRC